MKKLLFAVMLLTLSSLVFSQQVVIIEANKGWQNSGISISAGENLLFFARGAWASNIDGRPLNWWGPSGRGTAGVGAPLSSAPGQALIGKIGSNGTPFEIGSYLVYGNGGQDPVNQSGILYMRINDSDATLGDNSGMVYVSVFKSFNISIASINAMDRWQNTGIHISTGNSVIFLTRGAWATNFDGRPLNWWGPSGRGGAGVGAPLSSSPGQAIIGRIGSNGAPFEVGSYMVYGNGGQDPLNQSGTLYLRINDSDATLGDNQGTMVVAVIQKQGGTAVQKDTNREPQSFKLNQNYPNPFNPVTTIEFELFSAGLTKLFIFNQNGQKVTELINQYLPAGKHSVTWNGRNSQGNKVSSGAYYYQIFSNKDTQAKKMILVR